MSSVSEAACSYAALILHDDGNGIPITAEKILPHKLKPQMSVSSLIGRACLLSSLTNVGAGGGGGAPVASAAPVAAAGGGGAAAAEEKNKEEPEEESSGY